MSKKAILIIMDGWGDGNRTQSDAIFSANTAFTKSLYNHPDWAYNQLKTSGLDVGLPEGQMGNSEVGHMNIGAGRVMYQDLVRINIACEDNSIASNPTVVDAYKYAKENKKKVHFIGLVSDGGVHSMTSHLIKLCEVAKDFGLQDVFIHALTDGRDTDPRSGLDFMKGLVDALPKTTAKIASLNGRYWGMDRDKRWDRIKLAYDLFVHGKGTPHTDVLKAIQDSYNENVTDEFIKPVVFVDNAGKPLATVQEGDVVICFNFRTDRLRQITSVLSQKDMPELEMKKMPLYYVTMATYDDSFQNVKVIFDKDNVQNTMGEILEKAGKTQLRIAETEKYAHVTFFFSGGQESEFKGENRILIQSPKVATYDLQPEMSAPEVKQNVIKVINEGKTDFICLNFANSDMVGHTGVYEAIVKAVETVDSCVKEVVEAALKNDYSVFITADHGNSDNAINEDGSPNTAHSLNPVPAFLYDKKYKKMKPGRLADIAPTLLTIMELPVPKDMTGQVLVG